VEPVPVLQLVEPVPVLQLVEPVPVLQPVEPLPMPQPVAPVLVPQPVVGPGPTEASKTRFQVTNSGATRQQVAMFAQSVTASIFRQTHNQMASQHGRNLASAAMRAAMATAAERRIPARPPMGMSLPLQQPQVGGSAASSSGSAPFQTTMLPHQVAAQPRSLGSSSLSPIRQPPHPASPAATRPSPRASTIVSQRSAGGSTSWSPSRPARNVMHASPTRISEMSMPSTQTLSGPLRLPPGGGPAANVRTVPTANLPPRRVSHQPTALQPRVTYQTLSADEDAGFD